MLSAMSEDLLVNSTNQESGPNAQVLEIRRRTNRMFGLFLAGVLLVVLLLFLAILLGP